MTDLLSEPVLTATGETGSTQVSLPGLLAALALGEVRGLAAMRPHQRPALHMFLVQLAVLALRDANGAIPDTEAVWRDRLLALTGGDPGPWALVGPADRPAFLQPADPGGLKWTEVATLDALDMLITSKNHDLKQAVAVQAAPEDWFLALVSLQTMEGYGGRGNTGIARMNGGSSSRAMLGLAPMSAHGLDMAAWWRRDVTTLRAGWPQAPGTKGGAALLWLLPWPEGRQLPLTDLDPAFLEICRRVRLDRRDGRIVARRSTSTAARIAAKEAKGVTGDPWCPVHRVEGKALTLGPRRFDYRLICELIWGNDKGAVWQRPHLAEMHPGDADTMLLVAEALARGNSRTDGFMSRVIPVPPGQGGWTPEAGDMARAQIEEIARFDHALRDGLATLAARGDRAAVSPDDYARAAPARAEFEAHADAMFFPALWDRVAAADEFAARARFLHGLHDRARAIFRAAMAGVPCPSALRPRAEVMAGMAFRASLRRKNEWAHVIFPDKQEDENDIAEPV